MSLKDGTIRKQLGNPGWRENPQLPGGEKEVTVLFLFLSYSPWSDHITTITYHVHHNLILLLLLLLFLYLSFTLCYYSLSRCEDLLHELLPSSVARFNVFSFTYLSDKFQKSSLFFNLFSNLENYSFLQCFVFYKKKSDLYFE